MNKLTLLVTSFWMLNTVAAQELPTNFFHIDTTEGFHTTFLNSVDGKVTRTDYASILESLYKPEKKTIRIFTAEGRIDTLTKSLFHNPKYCFDEPALYYNDSAKIIRLDLKDYTQEKILDLPEYHAFWKKLNDGFLCLKINGGEFEHDGKDGGMLYYEQMAMKSILLDQKGNSKILFDIEKDGWPVSSDHDIGDLICFSDGDKIAVETAIEESGGRWKHQYFLIDIENRKLINFDKLNEYTEGSNKYITDEFFDVTGKYLFVPAEETMHGETLRSKVLLFDHDFNYLQECLPRKMRIMGYNYEQDTAVSVNLHSKLDVRESRWDDHLVKAIIAYPLTVHIEKTLYAIYHNQQLSRYDLEQLNRQQLQLAKNMIFARHNYQFDSPYYQAFFNLFNFYNTEEMRKTRTRTMEGKMSINDVQNSRLINQVIRSQK